MTYCFRFIFVHFNAWEHVGSDILWAGIVTSLASAIEAEFGVMTSRIFRLLNLDVIQNDGSSNEKTLLLNLRHDQTDEQLKEFLKEYGVLKRFRKLNGKVKQDENFQKWMVEVEYSNYMEAAHAYEAMTSKGIEVTKRDMKKESRPLFCQFCKHFLKHPKTNRGFPKLCWLPLSCIASFCLFVIASQAVTSFDLDFSWVSLNTLMDLVFIQREV